MKITTVLNFKTGASGEVSNFISTTGDLCSLITIVFEIGNALLDTNILTYSLPNGLDLIGMVPLGTLANLTPSVLNGSIRLTAGGAVAVGGKLPILISVRNIN